MTIPEVVCKDSPSGFHSPKGLSREPERCAHCDKPIQYDKHFGEWRTSAGRASSRSPESGKNLALTCIGCGSERCEGTCNEAGE